MFSYGGGPSLRTPPRGGVFGSPLRDSGGAPASSDIALQIRWRIVLSDCNNWRWATNVQEARRAVAMASRVSGYGAQCMTEQEYVFSYELACEFGDTPWSLADRFVSSVAAQLFSRVEFDAEQYCTKMGMRGVYNARDKFFGDARVVFCVHQCMATPTFDGRAMRMECTISLFYPTNV